jgi:starch synthase
MKILFATSEMAPLIKTGGLADVSGSLPAALRKTGADVRVLLPAYPAVLQALDPTSLSTAGQLPAYARMPAARLLSAVGPQGLPLLLLDSPMLFERQGNPYLGPDGRDWPDNDLRFGLLSWAAARLSQPGSPLAWHPDVLHVNDWQTGLAPVYLVHDKSPRASTVITVHNLAYQGNFSADSALRLGLPAAGFTVDGAEFYGQLSFLKGALATADAITTVSPSYAREICAPALGFGLDGLLRKRGPALSGILNGIDTDDWNPATDQRLPARFDAKRLAQRALNKRAIQTTFGLTQDADRMLFGMITRLVEQKGVDLVADVVGRLLGLPAQLVILGTGDRQIERRLQDLAQQHPGAFAVKLGFDENLAHTIEGGVDAFLMPSRFEPCGMNQMYSQRYGALPVVCRTGGLADSVIDAQLDGVRQDQATGFAFAPPSQTAMWQGIQHAYRTYLDEKTWRAMQRAAMARDFSWEASAQRYLEVYRRIGAPL